MKRSPIIEAIFVLGYLLHGAANLSAQARFWIDPAPIQREARVYLARARTRGELPISTFMERKQRIRAEAVYRSLAMR